MIFLATPLRDNETDDLQIRNPSKLEIRKHARADSSCYKQQGIVSGTAPPKTELHAGQSPKT